MMGKRGHRGILIVKSRLVQRGKTPGFWVSDILTPNDSVVELSLLTTEY